MKLTKAHFAIAVISAVMAFIFSFLYFSKAVTPIPQSERPDEWSTPIDINGLPNLHKVTEDLYRGAQPTADGIEQLKKMGIKTIINLRSSFGQG